MLALATGDSEVAAHKSWSSASEIWLIEPNYGFSKAANLAICGALAVASWHGTAWKTCGGSSTCGEGSARGSG